ncbi:hypothetical protein BJ165DRAFT_319235 [Panaeolus papilionaceus]|nr:hypothetical protein BJ165DRAFT_319235 [Panaeolus papilionaceus]
MPFFLSVFIPSDSSFFLRPCVSIVEVFMASMRSRKHSKKFHNSSYNFTSPKKTSIFLLLSCRLLLFISKLSSFLQPHSSSICLQVQDISGCLSKRRNEVKTMHNATKSPKVSAQSDAAWTPSWPFLSRHVSSAILWDSIESRKVNSTESSKAGSWKVRPLILNPRRSPH